MRPSTFLLVLAIGVAAPAVVRVALAQDRPWRDGTITVVKEGACNFPGRRGSAARRRGTLEAAPRVA